jgi:hypothetical protein
MTAIAWLCVQLVLVISTATVATILFIVLFFDLPRQQYLVDNPKGQRLLRIHEGISIHDLFDLS